MLIVFEVHLSPNRSSDDFLSEEALEETQAQVMTPAEARAIGFEGVPDDPNLRLVAVAHRDRKFIARILGREEDAEEDEGEEEQQLALAVEMAEDDEVEAPSERTKARGRPRSITTVSDHPANRSHRVGQGPMAG